MKSTAIILCLLVLAALASAQLRFTNSVTRAEAIRAVTELEVGMPEQNAGRLLASHRLTNFNMIQLSNECQRSYPLIDGYLSLIFTPQVISKDGRWAGIGLLRHASIFPTNNWEGTPITLTNRP
jgi:hypothetical protein